METGENGKLVWNKKGKYNLHKSMRTVERRMRYDGHVGDARPR